MKNFSIQWNQTDNITLNRFWFEHLIKLMFEWSNVGCECHEWTLQRYEWINQQYFSYISTIFQLYFNNISTVIQMSKNVKIS